MSQTPSSPRIDPHAVRIMRMFDAGKRTAQEGDGQFIAYAVGRRWVKNFDSSNLSRYRNGSRCIPLQVVAWMVKYLEDDPDCSIQGRAIVMYVMDMMGRTTEMVECQAGEEGDDEEDLPSLGSPSNSPGF